MATNKVVRFKAQAGERSVTKKEKRNNIGKEEGGSMNGGRD
jgi:hypothetical protein